MVDLLARVRQSVVRHGLLATGTTVVLGVSGGPDSLCLLHLLARLAGERDLVLHVAHLDHGLRGDEARADARFVREQADSLSIPCTIASIELRSDPDFARYSLEEAARLARYRFLAGVAEQVGAGSVAVGHTRDDQAETVLMHFLRGSGVSGLRGMLPLARFDETALGRPTPVRLERPLLDVGRADTEAYCTELGLTPRVDASNEDRTILRNRLRHELLPLLESYNPNIRSVLSRTATVMAGDHELLREAVEKAWTRVVRPSSDGEVLLDLDAWRGSPLGMQRALVREAIRQLKRGLRNINAEHVEQAVWLAREGYSGQIATLTGGLALELGYGKLRVAAEGSPAHGDFPQVQDRIRLAAPGDTEIGRGWRVTVEAAAGEKYWQAEHLLNADPWTVWLDADAIEGNLALRTRTSGDEFRPLGMGGHRAQVREVMINKKIPRAVRANWPLLVDDGGILWLCGLRQEQRGALGPDSRRVWLVRFRRLADVGGKGQGG